jgi:hypothetical protein
MDKTALAAQIAACVTHTGDLFAFGGQTFSANVESAPDTPAEFDRQTGDNTTVKIICARAELVEKFGTKLPDFQDVLTDAAGHLYRIQASPSHPLSPTVIYLCGNVVARPTP